MEKTEYYIERRGFDYEVWSKVTKYTASITSEKRWIEFRNFVAVKGSQEEAEDLIAELELMCL